MSAGPPSPTIRPRLGAALRLRRLDPIMLAILLLGLTLRLIGLHWGLPNSQHYQSYHPDEILLVGAASRVDPLVGRFDTGFYNYGSLTILAARVLYDVADTFAPTGPEVWKVSAQLHLIGRLLSVLLGTATLWVVYAVGRRLAGRTAGLCGAALLAVAPGHVAHSHYFTVDVAAGFFAMAAVSAALPLLHAPRLKAALLAGACAGLAAATKYNAGLAVLAPLAALLLFRESSSRAVPDGIPPGPAGEGTGPARRPGVLDAARGIRWRRVAVPALACIAAAGIAFLAGCPGVLLSPAKFMADFLYEVQHVRTGHGLLFEKTLPGWIYHVVNSSRFALGIPALLAVLAGLIAAVRRRARADVVVAAWAVSYYLLIGAAQVKFLRYTLPLLPPLAVWAGVACADWLAGAGSSRLRALGAAGAVGVAFWTLGSAIGYDLLFATTDPRDRAALWAGALMPRHATVALTTVPWFYTPPLVPWNGGAKTEREFWEMRPSWPYEFLPGGWTGERVERERPQFFIVSDLELRDGLRLGLPETRGLVSALDHLYKPQLFRPLAAWPGLLGPGYPPEDWLYPAPTLFVYARQPR